MEFQYSSVLELPASETQGLNQGIPIRVHRNRDLEDYGAIRAQEDWSRSVEPLGFYKGGLASRLGFISAVVPECLPDRLEYVSYVNEFEFIYDDMVDKLNDADASVEGDARLEVFKMWTAEGSMPSYTSAKMELQAKLIRDALAIDREAAMWTVKIWADYVEKGAGRKNHSGFKTLDDYIEYRYHDIGTMLMTFEIAFGMGLVIPEHEHPILLDLARPAWISIALTNDLFSWGKECRFADQQRIPHDQLFSSIPILMRQNSVGVEEAKENLRGEIRKYVTRYVKVVEENKDRTDFSPDLCRYLEALMYGISGNLAYSIDCPRYNLERTYSTRQLEWMTNGVPAVLPREDSGETNDACA
ncbi:hypothetical protein MFIFM68171_07385 [Madurella fahalii]|uniref:Terpene synthase n=1 Tax=Madurella fahalii TaxID=1157608 RepID=A0ABQ0GHZ4_9PEZI